MLSERFTTQIKGFRLFIYYIFRIGIEIKYYSLEISATINLPQLEFDLVDIPFRKDNNTRDCHGKSNVM